jgi:hypothetical protein
MAKGTVITVFNRRVAECGEPPAKDNTNAVVEQNGDGVQVAGEGIGPNAEGFQRNAAAAGERLVSK